MARMVRHAATDPFRIDPQTKAVFVCACGLSKTMPFCDGSHKTVRTTEEPGKLYVYGPDRATILKVEDDPADSGG